MPTPEEEFQSVPKEAVNLMSVLGAKQWNPMTWETSGVSLFFSCDGRGFISFKQSPSNEEEEEEDDEGDALNFLLPGVLKGRTAGYDAPRPLLLLGCTCSNTLHSRSPEQVHLQPRKVENSTFLYFFSKEVHMYKARAYNVYSS